MAKDEYVDARILLERVITTDTSNPKALNALGVCAMRTGDDSLAVWAFRQAVEHAPNAPEPRNNLGILYERAGKLPEAIVHYEVALQQSDDIVILGNLTRVQVKMGIRNDPVINQLRQIQASHPEQNWQDWASRIQIHIGSSD